MVQPFYFQIWDNAFYFATSFFFFFCNFLFWWGLYRDIFLYQFLYSASLFAMTSWSSIIQMWHNLFYELLGWVVSLFPYHKQQCGNKECTLLKTVIEVQYKHRKHIHTAHKLTTLLEAAPRSWTSPEAPPVSIHCCPSHPGLVPFVSALKQEMISSFKCDYVQGCKKRPASPWGSTFAYEMLAQAKEASACVHARFRRFNTKPPSPLQCLQLLNLGFIAYSGSYGKWAYWSGALRSCLLSGHFYGPFFVAKDLWPA